MNNVKKVRKFRGLTGEQLAIQCGTTKGYISDLERGILKNPSLKIAKALSDALGVSIDELFFETEITIKG